MNHLFKEHYYTSFDGLKLHVREYPCQQANSSNSSPPQTILCIPGLTRNCRDFTDLCEYLSHDYRLFAVDLRGRGLSDYDPAPENYHPGTYLQDILTLLDDMQLPPVVLIGTSLGGLISQHLAASFPDKIKGVVLNDIGPEVEPEGIRLIQDYVGLDVEATDWTEAVMKTRRLNEENFPDLSESQWLAFTKGLYRIKDDGHLILDYDPAIRVLFQQIEPDALPDLWEEFEKTREIPMLLVRGCRSKIISDTCIQRMQSINTTLKLCELPNRGHAPLLNEPEVLQAITAFLSGLN